MAGIPFSEVGVAWFEEIVRLLTRWFLDPLEHGLEKLGTLFFNTPLPRSGTGIERVFGVPPASDEPWHTIHEAVVAGEVMVFALIILFLCVQGRQVVRIFNVGTAFQQRRTERSAWTGAVLIVGWYWLAVLILYFVQGLTVGLLPDVSELGPVLLELLPAALGNPMLTLLLSIVGGISMLLLQALFFIRQILLYGYLYLMPIGLALAFGNLPVVSRIARRLCRQFVPLAILPLPAAVLFRTYGLLFESGILATPTRFLAFVVVVSLPVLALYLTWKTFRYASPLTARLLGGTARTAVTAGAIATAGTVAGPRLATTAAKWGPKTAAGQAVAQRAFSDGSDTSQRPTGTGSGAGHSDATASPRGSQSTSPDRSNLDVPAPPLRPTARHRQASNGRPALEAGPSAADTTDESINGKESSASSAGPTMKSGAELLAENADSSARTRSESEARQPGQPATSSTLSNDRSAAKPPGRTQVRRTENDPADGTRIQPSSSSEDDIPYIESTVHRDSSEADNESDRTSRAGDDQQADAGQRGSTDSDRSSTNRDESNSATDDD